MIKSPIEKFNSMQKINDCRLFSASDLVNFLECENLTYLDLKNFNEKLQKAADDEQAKLMGEYPESVIDIAACCHNREDQFEATKKAMQGGFPIIIRNC